MTPEEASALSPEIVLVSLHKDYGSKVSYRPYREASEEVHWEE
jgi:hypothetical protein